MPFAEHVQSQELLQFSDGTHPEGLGGGRFGQIPGGADDQPTDIPVTAVAPVGQHELLIHPALQPPHHVQGGLHVAFQIEPQELGQSQVNAGGFLKRSHSVPCTLDVL